MALQWSTTRQEAQSHGIKFLVHGFAGTGKTPLCATAPRPLILSAEAGLRSIGHHDIPVIKITSMDDFDEAYQFCAYSEYMSNFDTVCLDSISEIAEVCLGTEKALNKDPRKAYGEMQDKMMARIRWFRDLPGKHVYFSAKAKGVKDEMTGITRYGPSMPGQNLGPALPYLFDEVFSLETFSNPEGLTWTALRTGRGPMHEARDRSGALEPFEQPDLTNIINKILTKAA